MHTIAINSGCPPHANRNIRNEILDPKKLFYPINTAAYHYHIMGNTLFRDAGAEIIAHDNTKKEMAVL